MTPSLDDWRSLLDNDWYKISFDSRLRVEIAEANDSGLSAASTVRTRFGIGNKPRWGFRAFVEGEGTFSFDNDAYYSLVDGPSNKTTVSDPEAIKLNRGFLEWADPAWMNAKLVGGRQRIIFDDARFVGNVGWRQNEQTFDAALGSTSFGIENLTGTYSYVWNVARIWSDRGGASTQDFESDAHFFNLAFDRHDAAKVALFAYVQEFDDSPSNSNQTYGLRVNGQIELTERWSLGYIGSYAFQADYQNQPNDYDAHYAWVTVDASHAQLGTIRAGYEHLGSDEGDVQFLTPLATAHKFNGFADVFLNNGGPRGLQDVFVVLTPKLPMNLKASLYYHHFRSAQGSDHLGNEFDFVVSRPIGWGFVALMKGAWFWSDGGSGLQDTYRVTSDISFKF